MSLDLVPIVIDERPLAIESKRLCDIFEKEKCENIDSGIYFHDHLVYYKEQGAAEYAYLNDTAAWADIMKQKMKDLGFTFPNKWKTIGESPK